MAPTDRDAIFCAWDLKYAELVAAGEFCRGRVPEIAASLTREREAPKIAETQTGQASVGVITSPGKNVALINNRTCDHLAAMEKPDALPAPKAPLTGSLERNYPVVPKPGPNDFAANRTDIEGWAELLKLVADEPEADAQLLADATVGLPREWRQTIWQRLSSQVRDRLQQIRNLVQPGANWRTSTSP